MKNEQRTEGTMSQQQQYYNRVFRSLIPKWILSYIFFMLSYTLSNKYLLVHYKYDPSGHILCSIVSYSNWLNILITLQEFDADIFSKDTLCQVICYIGYTLQIYQLYSLVFTAKIYHHYSETCMGFFNGVCISWFVFQGDELSTVLYNIFQMITAYF